MRDSLLPTQKLHLHLCSSGVKQLMGILLTTNCLFCKESLPGGYFEMAKNCRSQGVKTDSLSKLF